MSDDFTLLNAGTGGDNMDEEGISYGISPTTRKRPRVVIGGNVSGALVSVINTTPTGSEYGLITRVACIPSFTVAGTTAKTANFNTGSGSDVVQIFGIAVPTNSGATIGGTSTNPIKIDPTGTTTQPITGTGIAGTPSAGVLTIQGVTGMTPVQVDLTSSSVVTVSGTVIANAGSGTFNVQQQNLGLINYATGGSTVNQAVMGLALPGTTGPVAGGTTTNPVVVNQTGSSTLNYNTSGNTQLQVVGVALPASGGPVQGGTLFNPIRTDPTGTTIQPITNDDYVPGRRVLLSSTSINSSSVTSPLINLGEYKNVFVTINCTAVPSGGVPSLDVYLQHSGDNATTWQDIMHTQFTTSTKAIFGSISGETAGSTSTITASDGVLAGETVIQGAWGDQMRIKYKFTSGGSSGSYTLVANAVLK